LHDRFSDLTTRAASPAQHRSTPDDPNAERSGFGLGSVYVEFVVLLLIGPS